MKKICVLSLMGAVLTVTLASPVLADPIPVPSSGVIRVGVSNASPYGPYQAGIGGEFTLNDIGTPADSWLNLSGYVAGTTSNLPAGAGITSFQTFCIEVTEHIAGFSQTYNAQLNTSAVYGSLGSGDPVSQGTGWLYSQFARGALAGYIYADAGNPAPRKASADLLQKAFWWLENEPGYSSAPGSPADNAYILSNIYIAAAVSNFGGDAVKARLPGAENYGVYAVNLWNGPVNTKGLEAQDQLYYKPTVSSASVPDGGATLALFSMAFAGIIIAWHRRTM